MLRLVDYTIVVAYLIGTMAIGFVSARKGRGSSKSFFVAEKSLPWWVIGLTMVASGISAEQMLGEVGYGFDAGLAVSNWDLAVYPSLLLMVLVFLPTYLRSGITTAPEYLEKRYGRSTRLLFAGYTVFNNACVALVMVLALGGIALKYFLGISPVVGILFLAAFTGVYAVYGGMSSVAWTDAFQGALLLVGGLAVFGIGLARVPDGWDGLFSRMPEPHLIRGLEDPYMPWPGLLLLALSTNVWYCCTNQFYIQSCLGARCRWHGQMGVLLTAFLGPILTLCLAFPGYIARDLIEHGLVSPLPRDALGAPDVNATYPHLVNQLLGPGLRGLIVAVVLAAIMSTISAIVHATASVFTVDIYQRWLRPDADERRLIRVGRTFGVLTLLIAFPLSLVAIEYKYVFIYSQNAWCILAIPVTIVFSFGVFWRRATNAAATATFLFVLPFVVIPFLLGERSFLPLPASAPKVHLFTFAFVLWFVAAAFMAAVSCLTRASDAERIAPYVWARVARDRGQGSRHQEPIRSVAFLCLVAAAMYAVIYWKYW